VISSSRLCGDYRLNDIDITSSSLTEHGEAALSVSRDNLLIGAYSTGNNAGHNPSSFCAAGFCKAHLSSR
jgi:hypothetical protein